MPESEVEVSQYQQSILLSVKKLLGPSAVQTAFDEDIITHINSVFLILEQLGVGAEGFMIFDDSAVWSDFVEEDKFSAVRSYVYLKTRLMFDPPQSSSAIEVIKELVKELECRLCMQSSWLKSKESKEVVG